MVGEDLAELLFVLGLEQVFYRAFWLTSEPRKNLSGRCTKRSGGRWRVRSYAEQIVADAFAE
jgi:hypothetical protein